MTDVSRQDHQEWMRSILDRYEVSLTRYATRLTGDVESARDAVQETFLRFCSNGAPREDNHVAAWLYTVCRTRAFDARKKERPMQPLTERQQQAIASNGLSPPDGLEQQETDGELLQILASLPPSQQEAVQLRFLHELSYRDISQVMSTSVGNVGYLLHHALKAMRERMAPESPQLLRKEIANHDHRLQ